MYTLRHYQDQFAVGAITRPDLEAQHGMVYVLAGSISVDGRRLDADGATYYQDVAMIEGGPAGASVWRWELVRTGEADNLARGEGVASHLRMSRRIRMLELVPTSKWMLRLDGIFGHQGSTGLHSHPGSGIRVLVDGHLRVESDKGERSDNARLGDAWYEEGSYPVNATSEPGETADFLRGMVLPSEYAAFPANVVWLEGQSPFVPQWKSYILQLVTLR